MWISSRDWRTLNDKLDSISKRLDFLAAEEKTIIMDLTTLKAQVDKNRDLEESAVTLITGIAKQLAAAKTDPAAIQALSDELTASASDLATAITNNTPAA